ncbi:HTTM domain-containing protein [Microbacterium sp. KSW4-16]|uniref:HTTM domain-containing protein n=1 Tax=Microbacterium aurugineum TaxID=2851642 RepID=UPI0020C036C5|nr:HTTM domain-containing protein [Microbacterium aurugineum]MCK8469051.1 HTTM domain-containing protein [Microbacterium aurugineum]
MTKPAAPALYGLARETCGLMRTCLWSAWKALTNLLGQVERWLTARKHASYGLAVARMLLGVMIIGFVVSNLSTLRYTFGAGAAWSGQLLYPTSDFAGIFPFSLVNQAAHTDTGITLVSIALIVCAAMFMLGYRTRLVMVPLFVLWVGFLSINTYVQDQSDNLTRMSMIYMFFTALGDRWSLDARRRRKWRGTGGGLLARWWRYQRVLPTQGTNLFHNLGLVLIVCQLCFVYASGGLFKAAGEPWKDGTAVYDPLQTERFGTWPILSEIATTWGPGVAIATIATVLIQVSFPFMMLNRFTRIVAIAIILFFHASIGVLMGLPWFSLSMVALDAVFVSDKTWRKLQWLVRTSYRSRRPRKYEEPNTETERSAIEVAAVP